MGFGYGRGFRVGGVGERTVCACSAAALTRSVSSDSDSLSLSLSLSLSFSLRTFMKLLSGEGALPDQGAPT